MNTSPTHRSVTLSSKAREARAVEGVRLKSNLVASDDDSPKWVQIAAENQFMGYMGGLRPFEFTREHFQQMVANIQGHPSYKAGDNGEGTENIIPWDFNHASEANPTKGSLPELGAPARSWTLDLKIVDGADGKAQLWALTRFLDPAKEYVRNEQYQWASVAATFEAIHPVTGENQGALITSIAFTNTPFIEGMEKLVASAKVARATGEPVKLRHFYFDPARSPEEAVRMFKELLGLSETQGADALAEEVEKVRQFVDGEAPIGVDLDDIVSNFRTILGLPALSETSEVLDNADRMIQRLVEEATADQPAGASVVSASTLKDYDMTLLKILAGKLGTREVEDAVRGEVENLVSLREGLVALTGKSGTAGIAVLLEAAKEMVTQGKSAAEKLGALVKALGVEDPEGAVGKITDLVKQAKDLEEAMPELKELREEKATRDEKEVEEEVDAAMASRGLGAEMKDALMLFRKEKPADFAAKFPVLASNNAPAPAALPRIAPQLTHPLTATPSGAQLSVGGNGSQVMLGASPGHAQFNGAPIDLDIYVGKGNPTQRAYAHLEATLPNYAQLSHNERFTTAVALKKQSNVRFTNAVL